MRDDYSKGCLGYVVDKKGRSDDLAIKVCKDLEDFGIGEKKVILNIKIE